MQAFHPRAMTTNDPPAAASPMPPPAADPASDAAHGFSLEAPRALDVGEGHRLAWWQGGDAAAPHTVLVVHGGPGGRTRPEAIAPWVGLPVRWIAFDQRGCGRSHPRGETRGNSLEALLDDMERLRVSSGVERLLLAGGSWGALLALAYALRHPQRVSGLMLRSAFCGSAIELDRYLAPWSDWLGDAGRAALGADADALLRVFHRATAPRKAESGLTPAFIDEAQLAQAWSSFDDAQAQPGGVEASGTRWRAAAAPASDELLEGWRVFRHYAEHGWFLDRPLLETLATGAAGPLLRARPWVLVHGARDACCDPSTSGALAAWHGAATWVEVPEAGHRMGQPAMAAALRQGACRLLEDASA